MNNEYNCDCNIIHQEVIDSTKENMPSDDLLFNVSDFFKIMGDSTRLRIIWALDNNEMCVCDIANLLGMTKSSISHQLANLKESGLVKNRKVGKEVYYALDDEHVKTVLEIAIEHVTHKEKENEEISL